MLSSAARSSSQVGAVRRGFPTDLYWEATVLTDVTEEMEIAREESFGPVVPITRISSDDEALRIANASPYGLLTAVWTRDLARGLRFAEAVDAGWVNINESTNYWESHFRSGAEPARARVSDVWEGLVLEAFTEPKTVVVTLPDGKSRGELNNEPTARKMDTHVADALERGAQLVEGGSRATGFRTDLYWQATVLTNVTEEMEVAREESFGPIVPITRISSDDEALRIANASPYGLLTAVWTADLARGLRFAEAVDAGWVNINESTNYWESHLPFGGRAGSSSGIGRVGGSSVLEAFTESKTVVVTLR